MWSNILARSVLFFFLYIGVSTNSLRMNVSNDFADESFMIDEPSLGIDSLLNDTRESFFETPRQVSTPRKSVTPRKSAKGLFKEPHVPRKTFSCSKCSKKFRSENTLKKHLRSHVFKDAASQVISRDSVENAFGISVEPILAEMIMDNSVGDFSTFVSSFKEEHKSSPSLLCFKQLTGSVLCDSIVEKSFLMPSAMWSTLLCCTNTALNSEEIRNALKKHLLSFKEAPGEVCWPFVLEFFHKVSAAVSTILICSIAKAAGVIAPDERAARSSDDFSTVRDKTTAFHIFGFVAKQFCSKASNARKSTFWKKILDVIQNRFVKGGLVLSCPEGIEAWTAAISRGSLTFVGEDAFNFFIALAHVIQGMEERGGSLEHEAVLVKVFNTPAILTLWDTVIGNSLDQDDSHIYFLNSCCEVSYQCDGSWYL